MMPRGTEEHAQAGEQAISTQLRAGVVLTGPGEHVGTEQHRGVKAVSVWAVDV